MKSQFLTSIAFFLLISCTVDLQAKNYILGDVNFALGMNDYINYANIKRTNSPANLPYEDIKGSPYIFENFATGRVKLTVTVIDPKRSEIISKFIKDNKIKLSDKSDLIKLVNFLNTE